MYWTTINTAPNSSSFDLPDEGTPVVVKLPSDREAIARLFCNEFSEIVWQFKDGSYAFVCEYTDRELKHTIITKPEIEGNMSELKSGDEFEFSSEGSIFGINSQEDFRVIEGEWQEQ